MGTVAIPPYRSGNFRPEGLSVAGDLWLYVAIPPYRSGNFRVREIRSTIAELKKSQSHHTDQGASARQIA